MGTMPAYSNRSGIRSLIRPTVARARWFLGSYPRNKWQNRIKSRITGQHLLALRAIFRGCRGVITALRQSEEAVDEGTAKDLGLVNVRRVPGESEIHDLLAGGPEADGVLAE